MARRDDCTVLPVARLEAAESVVRAGLLVPGMALMTAAMFVDAFRQTRTVRAVAGITLAVVGLASFANDVAYKCRASHAIPGMRQPGGRRATSLERRLWRHRSAAPGSAMAPEAESSPDPEGYAFSSDWAARLESNRPYAMLKSALFALEDVVGRRDPTSGHRVPYRAWFDAVNEEVRTRSAHATTGSPDYVFLTSVNSVLRNQLLQGQSGYELIAEMHPSAAMASAPSFTFSTNRSTCSSERARRRSRFR